VQVKFAVSGAERFTWHDIRAKFLTDADRQGEDAQAIAGHANRSMTERYIKAQRIEVVEPLRRQVSPRR
jgi:integrase